MGIITGYTSPEGTVSYTYDANGNVLTVTDSHGTITRTYDALNRVLSYTDTYGKVIRYEYDAVGNLSKLIYPDNTAVTYAYDENHNLTRVIDWQGRVTAYTYDENNRVVGVTKPDGSVTTTVYDNKQRVTSSIERTSGGTIITGFEYIYDDLSRIVEEKRLDKNIKMCYTYDDLSRVTSRTIKNLSDDSVVSTEAFTYDDAGNIIGGSAETTFVYDAYNRLKIFDGHNVTYDNDNNMLSNGKITCTYDSANRLLTAGGHTYTYNAEDVRIRNLCEDEDTTYTYDTNCRLSRLLCKTTNGITTKYVYGLGLIGEEVNNTFKTYHFDSRGSTVAITAANGNITDTFAYDTYGKLISRTGTSNVIFGYNGRDGVVTDDNGLIYMRARYYSPDMRRFINADILSGRISNAITLNRYAYANANPAMYVDPTGMLVGGLIFGGLILGGLLLGLTGCSNQEKSTTSAANTQTSTPNITSREQAKALHAAGYITDEDVPPEYSWEPSIRSKHMEEQEKKNNPNSTHKTGIELDQILIEQAIQEALNQAVDWGASKMDDLAGFDFLIVPNKTPPSIHIGTAVEGINMFQDLYNIYSVAKENRTAGNPWQETVSDIGIQVIGLGWDAAWTVIIGTALGATGWGIGVLLSIGAGLIYEAWFAPAFDNYFEYD